MYLKEQFQIEEVKKIQSGHIRQYIKYLRERGKYTVVNKKESKEKNHPQNRSDFKKELSMTTIANYVRNIKVFITFLKWNVK
jgi:integrase/recombinase XerD